MKPESEIQQEIQIEAAKHLCVLMRNNCGALRDVNGRMVRFGLGNESKVRSQEIKSSDLIGITKVVVTPEMVGKVIGVFTAVEVKDEKWNANKKPDEHEQAQHNFLNWVRNSGGLAIMTNSIDEIRKLLKR